MHTTTPGDEYVEIARKYMPDMDKRTETFVRSLATCKRFGPSAFDRWVKGLPQERCLCFACLSVNIKELNEKSI